MSQPIPVPTSTRPQFKARQRAEVISATVLVLACLAIGVVTLVAIDDILISRWLWGGLLVFCVATAFFAPETRPPLNWVLYLVAMLTSWVLFATIANQGMLVVILVVVAALGNYVVPMWGVSLVSVANCVVIFMHMWLTEGMDVPAATAVTIFYGFIHSLAVMGTFEIIQEGCLRTVLEQRNVQLTAAAVMLEDSARTSERLRISRELHDLIGHQLTVLNLEMEAARHRNTQGDAYACGEHIGRASTVAKELLGDVRSTVSEFRDTSARDMTGALERMASAVPSLDVHIAVDDDVHPQDDQARMLIRAGQEIMTNTVRHANAQSLWLHVNRTRGDIRLVGRNDGPGIAEFEPGNGLRGLQERVELQGGTLDVTPHDGFRVEIRLPEQLKPLRSGIDRAVTAADAAGGAGRGEP